MPVVQLSIKHGYDPPTHLEIGRALAPLRDEGVLIIGSGLSYHNLRQFGPAGEQASHEFDAWLQHVLLELPPGRARAALLHWSEAPYARMAHPREDHLVPLMVALGAAETRAGRLRVSRGRFLRQPGGVEFQVRQGRATDQSGSRVAEDDRRLALGRACRAPSCAPPSRPRSRAFSAFSPCGCVFGQRSARALSASPG